MMRLGTIAQWTAAAALVLACSVEAKAQVFCNTTGDRYHTTTNCSDGSYGNSVGGSVMWMPAPQPQPDYVVPEASRRYLTPLLTIPELIAEHRQAIIDCKTNVPNSNCVARWDRAEAELAARGMCDGRPGEANADRRWQKCSR
jgi:hypothetical protein